MAQRGEVKCEKCGAVIARPKTIYGWASVSMLRAAHEKVCPKREG